MSADHDWHCLCTAQRPTCADEGHDWVHLRTVSFSNIQGTWGDEFFCRRCLAKRKVAR